MKPPPWSKRVMKLNGTEVAPTCALIPIYVALPRVTSNEWRAPSRTWATMPWVVTSGHVFVVVGGRSCTVWMTACAEAERGVAKAASAMTPDTNALCAWFIVCPPYR